MNFEECITAIYHLKDFYVRKSYIMAY